jgi:hypothetical protein
MKAKGFDFKQFAITHGEKVVLGIAGVLALLVLVKTTWGTYQKQPAALKKSAEDAKVLIASTKWPGDEQRKYPPDDTLAIQIDSMLTPIPGDRLTTPEGKPGLEFSISGTWSLYLREKPWTDPKYLPVRNLIAEPFRPVIAKRNESYALANAGVGAEGLVDPMDATGGAAGVEKPKPGTPGGFRTRKRSGAGFNGEPMGGDAGFQTPGPMGAGFQRPGPRGPGGAGAGAGIGAPMGGGKGLVGPMGTPGLPGGEGMGDMGGGGQMLEADGRRAVAVRGIFPIREQMRAYEKALHLPDGLSPLDYVRVYDFVLERAVSTDNGKTFGKGAAVDTKSNVEYLQKDVADFDPDIVAQGVTHYIITSPLPQRLLRYWGDEATHPELKNYRLSKEGQERQRLINEAIQEQKKRMKQFQDETQNRGFGGVQQNMTGDRSSVMQDSGAKQGFEQYLQGRFQDEMTSGMNDEEGLTVTQRVQLSKAEANAVGDLVLFRYFDFDVLPGRTYKYRVKLVIRNPLFGQPVEKLALTSRESNKNEFSHTGYSNETQPVTVKNDVDYFVENITDRRSPRMDPPSVAMTVYEWMPELGTVVKGRIGDLEPGQMIAGKDTTTKRLDPAREVLEINVESEFSSNSVLLDLQAGHRKLDERHMRELGLSSLLKNKITIPDQVIVVDELGRIRQLDPLSMKYRHSFVESQHSNMMAEFKDWEQDPANVSQVEGDMGDEGGVNMGDDLDNPVKGKGKGKAKSRKRGKKPRGSSPLRRGGSGGYNPYGSGGYNPYGGGGTPQGSGGYNPYGRGGTNRGGGRTP